MKLLFIAPQPIYSIRGTPISMLRTLHCLHKDGHNVVVLTYPIGVDINLSSVKIMRTMKIPFIKSVPIGPSFRKVILDVFLIFKTVFHLIKHHKEYDAIQACEEATIFTYPLAKLYNIPMVYDMDSFISEQLKQHPFFGLSPFVALALHLEKRALIHSKCVNTVCQDLTDRVHAIFPDKKVITIEDIPLNEESGPFSTSHSKDILDSLNINGEKLIVYTGNVEKYQGIELLLQSLSLVVKSFANFRLVVVGGEPDQIETLKHLAASLGISQHVTFVGKKSIEVSNAYLDYADILVSPRIEGTNTPLKIYTYMQSGKPIVATNLKMHTQALTHECSILAEPTPNDFSEGLLKVLQDSDFAKHLGQESKKVAQRRFTREIFDQKTRDLYNYVLEGKYALDEKDKRSL